MCRTTRERVWYYLRKFPKKNYAFFITCTAISQIKIDNVEHEFGTIPNVKEDITEIILNIKGLAIKNTSETGRTKNCLYRS